MESRFVKNDVRNGESGVSTFISTSLEKKNDEGVEFKGKTKVVEIHADAGGREEGWIGDRGNVAETVVDTSISRAERETSDLMTRKISEMAAVCKIFEDPSLTMPAILLLNDNILTTSKLTDYIQAGSILIDPTRPDTLLRAEVEALRAICEEPLRVFRRAMNLDGPGWKQFSNSSSKQVYQLLAMGNLVWRCIWSGVDGDEFEFEKIEGNLLDKAGYLWQLERGRWDRLPAPDEGVEGRIEIEEELRENIIMDVVMGGV
jgi:hypothetical protein